MGSIIFGNGNQSSVNTNVNKNVVGNDNKVFQDIVLVKINFLIYI